MKGKRIALQRFNIFVNESKLYDLLKSVGINVAYDTATDIVAYCCFHDNTDSPALNISKQAPFKWKCWSGACDKRGNLFSLLTARGYSFSEAKRIIVSNEYSMDEFTEHILALLKEQDEHKPDWCKNDCDLLRAQDRDNNYVARRYLLSRGISEQAYDVFNIGYAAKKEMLAIPVFDHVGQMAGIIGRSIDYKQYRYSTGLDRSKIIWNLNNVVAAGYDEIVLTEGAFDSIAMWDAGIENVGAVLGSSISTVQWQLLRKYFNSIVCCFDNDQAGKALTNSIFEAVMDLDVTTVRYEDERKDPGELSIAERKLLYLNRKSKFDIMLERD